jgi:hypothetical protein
MADEGRTLLDDAAKARAEKKAEMLTQGLKKYARAYLLITGRKLQNDAPDLLQEIGNRIARPMVRPRSRDCVRTSSRAAGSRRRQADRCL